LREARLILPTVPGSLKAIHEINKVFGGSTVVTGTGYWKGASESIFVVDIAYDPSTDTDTNLYDIAYTFLKEGKQESVYLRYGNGNVQFVAEPSCMNNGEDTFDWEKLRSDLHRDPDDPNDIGVTADHVVLIP
jgi:hypothetical protein